MKNDDMPVGRLLSRREAITLLGGAGVALLAAGCGGGSGGLTATTVATTAPVVGATPTPVSTAGSGNLCVVKPELTIGPYFVDERLNRSDIRSDPTNNIVKQGALLQLSFNVSNISGGACSALSGAMVDVWHCDAAGLYSDISQEGTSGQKFLRGFQITDNNGLAQFTTIYPGWYRGRAVHLHFRIRNSAVGGTYDFISQIFFPDTLTDAVFAQAPYNVQGTRDTRNAQDGIYNQGGSQLLVSPTQTGAGYAATLDIALQA